MSRSATTRTAAPERGTAQAQRPLSGLAVLQSTAQRAAKVASHPAVMAPCRCRRWFGRTRGQRTSRSSRLLLPPVLGAGGTLQHRCRPPRMHNDSIDGSNPSSDRWRCLPVGLRSIAAAAPWSQPAAAAGTRADARHTHFQPEECVKLCK